MAANGSFTHSKKTVGGRDAQTPRKEIRRHHPSLGQRRKPSKRGEKGRALGGLHSVPSRGVVRKKKKKRELSEKKDNSGMSKKFQCK